MLRRNLYCLLFLFFINITAYASDDVLAKRLDMQWQNKPSDMLVLGQAIFDIIYKFDDEEECNKYLKSINRTKGSAGAVPYEVIVKVMRDLKHIGKQPGGTTNNTAVGVASFGGKVGMLSVVADDELGRLYAQEMPKYKVQGLIKKVHHTGQIGTGVIIIIISPDGERTMLAYPGISKQINEQDIDENLIKNYKIVLSEGYLWSDDKDNNDAIRKFYSVAKERGCITAFTFGDHSIIPKNRIEWLKLMENIDIIFADEQQIYTFLETKDWEKITKELQKHKAIFIITYGENGAYIVHGKEKIYIPAHLVKNIADSTGAGDQFAAGFLYGFARNFSLERSGQLGSTAAATIIQQIGAKPDKAFTEILSRYYE